MSILPQPHQDLRDWRSRRPADGGPVLRPWEADRFLRDAVMHGDAQAVRGLLQDCPEWAAWQATASRKEHPAEDAVFRADLECVKAFSELTDAATWTFQHDATLLSIAVESKFTEAFPPLLSGGAHPARHGRYELCPVWLAAHAEEPAWREASAENRRKIETEGVFAKLAQAIEAELIRFGLPPEDKAGRAAWWNADHEPEEGPVRGPFALLAAASGEQCGWKVNADVVANPTYPAAKAMRNDETGADWLLFCARKLVELGAEINEPAGSLSLAMTGYAWAQTVRLASWRLGDSAATPPPLAKLLRGWVALGARWDALGAPRPRSGKALTACDEGTTPPFDIRVRSRKTAAVAAAQGLSATALAAVEALGESLGHRWTQEERVRAAAAAWCSLADWMVNLPASPHRQPEHLTPYLAIAQGLSEKADFWPNWAPKGGLDEATKWEAGHPQQWSAEQASAIRESVALMESLALDRLSATACIVPAIAGGNPLVSEAHEDNETLMKTQDGSFKPRRV